jgi:hypothetical protein
MEEQKRLSSRYRGTASLCGLNHVALLLRRVNMPNDVVRETNNLVSGALGHLGESFSLGLIFKGVTGEVDAYRPY